jgi:DNA polymerase I
MSVLYLIDGHAYIHRAYHALPPLNNSRGQPVNAVYGFLRMLWKIVKQEKPDHLIVCFDTAAPTFRHEAYADYKATRKETDDALRSQIPLAREAVQALNIPICELDGYEADDVIAHLTREAQNRGLDVVIVSGDKDTLQLVNNRVRVLSEPKNVLYDPEKVREKYGLPPETLPDYFALIGDSIDNVPGIPGIGPKTATKLLQDFGSLEALLKAAPQIKGKTGELLQQHAEGARKSRQLVTLEGNVPLTMDWGTTAVKPPQAEVLGPFLKRMEFFSMLDEIIPQTMEPSAAAAGDYVAFTDKTALQEWCRAAASAERVAIETIPSSNDPLHARLLGIALCVQAGVARYLPLHSASLQDGPTFSIDEIKAIIEPLLEGKKPKLCGHNLKFTQLLLQHNGLHVGDLHSDTMVASYVLNPSRGNHGLKELVLEMLTERLLPQEQLLGKGAQKITMEEVPVGNLTSFACANVDAAFRAAVKLENQIETQGLEKLYYELEMPLVEVLARMEERGIGIDRPYLQALGESLQSRISALEKKIYEHAGEPFNINSPKQLATILFEKLKLPVIRRTKTGISTDEEVLKTLSANHPMPAALMDFRELQKLKSTYIDGLQAGLAPGEQRIHTNFNQTVAATGRLSSSNPNLQNIPIRTEEGRQIRKAFVPAKGTVFLSADYSQIDLRVLAHISQDPVLMKSFKDGDDVHLRTASEVFGVAESEVTADMRRAAKSINFGIVYGISPFGLSQQLQIPAEQSKQYIARYFERYPGVKSWIDQILLEARDKGYVKTLAGRIRYLPEILSKNGAMRGFAERTAMNTPIQGTSADIIKIAMLQLESAADRFEWKGKMLVQVHDELLFEVEPEQLENGQAIIKRIMEQALPLDVPVIVDLKVGQNWAEMVPVKKA